MKIYTQLLLLCTTLLLSGCKWFSLSCNHDHKNESKELASSKKTTSSVIKIINKAAFEKNVIQASQPVVVDFSAKWCGACQTMKPVMNQLEEEFRGKYSFFEVDVDAAEDLAHEFNVKGIPLFIFFKNGKEIDEKLRITGAVSKEQFKDTIKKAFETFEK
jgi:thioredoxin 1